MTTIDTIETTFVLPADLSKAITKRAREEAAKFAEVDKFAVVSIRFDPLFYQFGIPDPGFTVTVRFERSK